MSNERVCVFCPQCSGYYILPQILPEFGPAFRVFECPHGHQIEVCPSETEHFGHFKATH